MKCNKFVIPAIACCLLAGSMGVHAADNEATYSGDKMTSQVSMEIIPGEFGVTVPMVIPLVLQSNGEVTEPSSIYIKNYSVAAVEVSEVEINGSNGWEITDYDDLNVNKSDLEMGYKLIAFKINGGKTKGSGTVDGTMFDNIPGNGGKEEINIDAVAAPQKTMNKTNVADIVFTVSWA